MNLYIATNHDVTMVTESGTSSVGYVGVKGADGYNKLRNLASPHNVIGLAYSLHFIYAENRKTEQCQGGFERPDYLESYVTGSVITW
jgi:hypothetical protein